MNILDVPQEKIEGVMKNSPDRMRLVFDECRELQKLFRETYQKNSTDLSIDSVDLNTVKGQLEVKQMIWNVAEELFELANCFKNRPWTQSQYSVDDGRVYDELADSAIFFVHLVRKLGLDSEKFTELLLKKIEVNKFRARSRY